MTAAVVGWLAGRLGWRRGTRRVAGPHVERIARRLGAGRGLRDVTMLRLVPVAPFTVVSVVCGALGVRLDLFLLATLAGTIPSLAVAALVIWALAG
jgi:phospholipase D1/2